MDNYCGKYVPESVGSAKTGKFLRPIVTRDITIMR